MIFLCIFVCLVIAAPVFSFEVIDTEIPIQGYRALLRVESAQRELEYIDAEKEFERAVLPQITGDTKWHESNKDFMLLDPVQDLPEAVPVWKLAVGSVDNSTTVRILYLQDELYGWENILWNNQEAPIEWKRYNAEGEVIFAEQYWYRRDGSMRGLRRCDAQKSCTEVRFSSISAVTVESTYAEDFHLEFRYAPNGHPIYIRRKLPNAVLEEEWLKYTDGNVTEHVIQRGDIKHTFRYADDLLMYEELSNDKRVVQTERRAYDAEDRLIRRYLKKRSAAEEESWQYTEEAVIRTYMIDGILTEYEETFPTGERVVTLYRAGEKILRSWYQEDTLTHREILTGNTHVGNGLPRDTGNSYDTEEDGDFSANDNSSALDTSLQQKSQR